MSARPAWSVAEHEAMKKPGTTHDETGPPTGSNELGDRQLPRREATRRWDECFDFFPAFIRKVAEYSLAHRAGIQLDLRHNSCMKHEPLWKIECSAVWHKYNLPIP